MVLLEGAAAGAQERNDRTERKERSFYHGYDYGNEALYNPLYVILNRGYDVLQIRAGKRNIFQEDYALNATNVAENLFVHPFASISEEGWGKFLREEIFPLSYKGDTARWAPNYSLHLLGGGMTFAQLSEWYDDQGLAMPWAWSAGTLMSAAFLNETIENKGVVGRNTDCIADFWVWDISGILLFSSRWVRRFFSQTVIIADWSMQPSFTYPGWDLHNQGNYYAFKWPLPWLPNVRLFAYTGMAQLAGVSYKLDSGLSVTAAGGLKSTRFVSETTDSVHNTVRFVPSAALFIDRHESLLASLQVSDLPDYFIHFNMYPNAFVQTDPGVGLWTVFDKTGHFILGVSVARALGLGAGYGRLSQGRN